MEQKTIKKKTLCPTAFVSDLSHGHGHLTRTAFLTLKKAADHLSKHYPISHQTVKGILKCRGSILLEY